MAWLVGGLGWSAEVGEAAPPVDLSAHTVVPPELTSVEGKVVLLNFWASWCGPCRAELPDLQALHERLDPEKALVLTVNLDTQQRVAEGLTRKLKVGLPVVYDPKGVVAGAFQPPSMPTSYLIDANGLIHKIYEGKLDEAAVALVEQDIQGLLP